MRPMQKKIIKALHVKPTINVSDEISKRVLFMEQYLKKTGTKTLILGISGGIDSSLAGKLCECAVSDLRQKSGSKDYKFIAVRLPYGKQADESDAMKAIKWIAPDVTTRVNIKPTTDALVKSIETQNDINISDFNKGNVKARERMVVQYAIAGEYKGLVVGTDHAAEGIVAFYTKYGDGASDICPLQGLDKRQVKMLLARLGAPKHLLNKTPTADLESNHPDQPDAVELGASYKDVDDYLEGKQIDTNVAIKLERKYIASAHKRHMPVNIYSTFWK